MSEVTGPPGGPAAPPQAWPKTPFSSPFRRQYQQRAGQLRPDATDVLAPAPSTAASRGRDGARVCFAPRGITLPLAKGKDGYGPSVAPGTRDLDILPCLKAGIPATTPMGAAGEVRGSRAGLPRRLPAHEGGMGRWVGCPAAIFLAAFTSALPAKPQAVHRNTAWLSRESRSTRPHAEHRWLVNAGPIFFTRPGALSASRR